MAAIINDNRKTPITKMGANLIPPKTKVIFNPQMVDAATSNLPTKVFANNIRTDGNIKVYYNANWTTYSRQGVYQALNYTVDWAHNTTYLPPFNSGSYVYYSANNNSQQYKFFTFINTTQIGPAPVYSSMMLESTLRVALSDPDLEFTTVNWPLPKPRFAAFRLKLIHCTVINYTITIVVGIMMS